MGGVLTGFSIVAALTGAIPADGEVENVLKGLCEELLFGQIGVEEAADLYLERVAVAIG